MTNEKTEKLSGELEVLKKSLDERAKALDAREEELKQREEEVSRKAKRLEEDKKFYYKDYSMRLDMLERITDASERLVTQAFFCEIKELFDKVDTLKLVALDAEKALDQLKDRYNKEKVEFLD